MSFCRGQGIVSVGDSLVHDVGPGDVVRIPAGVKQRIKNTGNDMLVFLAICSPRFLIENYQS